MSIYLIEKDKLAEVVDFIFEMKKKHEIKSAFVRWVPKIKKYEVIF